MLKFTNVETAAQFEALTDLDRIICKQKQYYGWLSNIPPEVAQGMVQRGSNLLAPLPPKPVAVEAQAIATELSLKVDPALITAAPLVSTSKKRKRKPKASVIKSQTV